jgi:hypothetical protein
MCKVQGCRCKVLGAKPKEMYVALDDEVIRQHDDLNRRSLELRRHL